MPVILVKCFLPKRTPNMGVGKDFPKIPTLECVIRRNGKHSYRKGYLKYKFFELRMFLLKKFGPLKDKEINSSLVWL